MPEQTNDIEKILTPEREHELLDRLIGYVCEYFDGDELYDILHNTLEMSHEDMEGLGFCLQEYYEFPAPDVSERIEQDVRNPLASHKTVDLIATYEEICRTPYDEHITDYIGDYGCHYLKYGVTDEQVRPIYEKALAAIEMNSDTFQRTQEFRYRGEIIGRMRECLLRNELKTGDRVLFVATEPYGAPSDFALRGGTIQHTDLQENTCSIRGEFFVMDDVPLRYVLGRHDPSMTDKHYGFRFIAPLFGEYPNLAGDYLREARDKWNVAQVLKQAQSQTMTM